MKYKIFVMAAFVVLASTFLADSVEAQEDRPQFRGVGLSWSTEAETVSENEIKCIRYGIYNPFDEDVHANVVAFGDLANISRSEPTRLVVAGTAPRDAIRSEVCFIVPEVYERDCAVGDMLCKLECSPDDEHVISGEVMAQYETIVPEGDPVTRTSIGFAAPLDLHVECRDVSRDIVPLYLGAVIILIVILAVVYRSMTQK